MIDKEKDKYVLRKVTKVVCQHTHVLRSYIVRQQAANTAEYLTEYILQPS